MSSVFQSNHELFMSAFFQVDAENYVTSGLEPTIKYFKYKGNEFKEKNVIDDLTAAVKTFTLLKNGYLACGCYDGKIQFFHSENHDSNGMIENGHSKPVNKTVEVNDFLVSCSDDATLKIWSSEYEFIKEIKETTPVNYLLVYEDKLLVLLEEGNIKVYSASTFQLMQTVKISEVGLYYGEVLKDGNIVIGGKDKTIYILNNSLEISSKKENAHNDWVLVIKEKGDNSFATGGRDGSIKIWDAKNLNCIKEIKNEQSIIDFFFLKNNEIIAGTADGAIKIFKI